MNKTLGVALLGLVLIGCTEADLRPSPVWVPDQAKRQTYFMECLKALPAGPKSTKYNDWDEVVEACQSASYYQSLYCSANCPPKPNEVKA